MTSRTNVAIVGAAGSCGRQLAVHLLDREILNPDARLQLVAHHGGLSDFETHGLRADLRDAFADTAPTIELIDRPEQLDADIVVILAGATIPTDPKQNVDRIALARRNLAVFSLFAEELGNRTGPPPVVVVQSNPVELGVDIFSQHIDRHLVIGAGAYTDTIRFRREIADSLGIRRTDVSAFMLGQHGDNLVPTWSKVTANHIHPELLGSWIKEQRANRPLDNLAGEIVTHRNELLEHVANHEIHEAFVLAAQLPPDIRAAVKAFLIHTTAGHTTEIVTAHSVADVISVIMSEEPAVLPLQVKVEGEYQGLAGVGGLPVRLTANGWTDVVDLDLAEDEIAALHLSFDKIASNLTLILDQ